MGEYEVQSKGKTLSGHFSPDEAIEVLETASNRGRSISEVIKRAVALGLPTVKKQYPPISDDRRRRPSQVHRVHIITPPLAKLMRKWKVLKEGRTLSGHFIPEQAIDVLKTAQARRMSTGSVLKAAVRIGLPTVKKQFPRVRST
jgi:hypothetical protein